MDEGRPDNTRVPPPPSLGDLAKLRISNWFKVGESLGFQDYDLQQIELAKNNQKHACQVAMFAKWLRDHTSPTAQDVIIALRDAGESTAADKLSQKYGEATEHHTLVNLPQVPLPKPATNTVLNLVISGPEKDGKYAVSKIANDILAGLPPVMDEKMRKNRCLLVQKDWISFLALFKYRILDMILSPHACQIVTHDIGELPEVTEMAPILLKGPLFHLLCFNLTQELNTPLHAATNLSLDPTVYKSWQTAKQCLYRAIEVVTTLNWPWENRKPKESYTTAIVGVYSGKYQQVFRELHKADADLKRAAQSYDSTKAIRYRCYEEDQMIFPFDLSGKSYDDARLKVVLQQELDQCTNCQFKISAYILLLMLAHRGGVLSFSECRYVSRLFGIPYSDFVTALKDAHNRLGMILHFREVPKMKNLVICDPRELTTLLKKFTKKALSGIPSHPQDPDKVHKSGEIPISLIDELLCQEEPADKLSVSCLLELLKYYKFLSETERVDGTTIYFMPCLLQPCSSLCSLSVEEQKTASLLFCFKHGHSPHSSLFTALIAQLARNWKLANVDRYKNFVTFIADPSFLTKVEVYHRGDHLQLVVLETKSHPSQWYSRVRHEMQRALRLVKIRYPHLSSEVCHVGFYCPRSLHSLQSPHCAMVRIAADGVAYLQCPIRNCQKICYRLEQRMGIWFAGEQPLTEKSVDGFSDLLSSVSLSSDIDEEDILQQIESNIVEEGSIPMRVVRCGLYGAPGVGKTSSMKRLTNQIENLQGQPILSSTGIDAPITVPLYNTTQQLPVLIADDQEWSSQDLDSQLQLIVQCIIKPDDDDPMASAQPSPAPGQNSGFSTPIQEASSPPSVTTSQPTASALSSSLSQVSEAPVAGYGATQIEENPSYSVSPNRSNPRFIRNLIRNKCWKETRNLLEFEDVTLLNIVDTGGQPEFQDILPVLLGGSGLSLLFLNLAQELEKPYPVVYRHVEEGTKSIEYRSQFTTLQMLFQVLATLTSTCTDHAAILVGTHQDEVTTKDINNLEEKVLNALQETEFLKTDVIQSFEVAGKKRNVFPLDNLTGSKSEIQQLQKIIRDVARRFPCKPLPTSWLLFHLALRYEHEKPGYCTMNQCVHLAARFGIQAKNVPQILLYFHKHFGTILYFPTVPCMANIVICNPSVIFTSINSLVVESFNSRESPHTTQSIRETGEISRKVLHKICQPDNADGKLLPTHHIIELLKHLNLITGIPSESEGSIFFMPCLLHYCNVESTSLELHAMNPAPLFIHFSCGYVPMGFFTGLIIELASEWMLERKRYKNRVGFITNKTSITRCTLTLHFNHIQVQAHQVSNEICVYIRRKLLSAFESMRKKFSYLEGIKANLRLLCPAITDGTKQFATCLDNESPEKMWCGNPACSNDNTHDLLPQQKIWFSSFKQTNQEEPIIIEETAPNAASLSSVFPPSVSSPKKTRKLTHDLTLPTEEQSMRTSDQTEMMEVCTSATGITAAQLPKLLRPITMDDISELTRDLSPVFNDWFELGIELGFSPALLKPIEGTYKKMSRCMIEMLEAWIKRGSNKTRSGIIEALRSPTLDHNAVAEELTRKYTTT